MGAPLCSRIVTFFDKLHTSHRFDTLYSLPTTSYHLLRLSLEDPLTDPLDFWGVNSGVNLVVNSVVNFLNSAVNSGVNFGVNFA